MANYLEEAIRFVAPGWAERRLISRIRYDEIENARANYEAAKVDKDWTTVGADGTAESVNAPDRRNLMLRARALERNNDMVQSIVGAITRNVIGSGIKPQARVKKGQKLHQNTNLAIEKLWKNWIKAKNCDITRVSTFYEMQEQLLLRRLVDGEALVMFVTDANARIPLKLQCLEADALANSTWYGNSSHINGIETDDYGAAIAYHINVTKPDGWTETESIRIPAERMLHIFRKTRFSQLRGVSELAPITRIIRDTGEYLDAELLSAKIRSCLSIFVQSPEVPMIGGRPNPNTQKKVTDSLGNEVPYLERGAIQYLPPGTDIRTVNGGQGAGNAKEFTQLESRRAGAAMGASYEVVTRDMSQSNYSSARQNAIEDRRTFELMQLYVINHICMPVYAEFLKACHLAGLLSLPGYWSNPEQYEDAVEWITPGWQWIDPLKDITASQMGVGMGVTTLSEICGSQGKDWQAQLEQRAEEEKYAKGLGLSIMVTPNGNPVGGGGGDGGDGSTSEPEN